MTVDQWNALYPIGTPVRYWPVAGEEEYIDTTTRSEAWGVSDYPVVKIVGRLGGCCISHMAVRIDTLRETVDALEVCVKPRGLHLRRHIVSGLVFCEIGDGSEHHLSASTAAEAVRNLAKELEK